ncbi:MAG: hypothetical protein AB7S77_01535, partial [Desulfatirhabdiaceae bacterium]
VSTIPLTSISLTILAFVMQSFRTGGCCHLQFNAATEQNLCSDAPSHFGITVFVQPPHIRKGDRNGIAI